MCDVPWVRNQVRAALSGSHEIVSVRDPYDAEVVAVAEGADLAIVDMQVGSMGGMAITRALKGANPGVGPIVLLLDRRAGRVHRQEGRCGCLVAEALHRPGVAFRSRQGRSSGSGPLTRRPGPPVFR